MFEVREKNFSLLRCLSGGQDHFAHELKSVTNYNYISKMATGDMKISDEMARQIEIILQYPKGWLDRDNHEVLKSSSVIFEILNKASVLSKEKQEALLKLIF